MPGLPENVLAEIAEKRTSSSEEKPVEETPKVEEPAKADESKKEEPKTDDPKPKKDEAAKPKNGQSIAQVAEAADEDDEEDEDADPKDGDKKKNRKRDSVLRELIDQKKENKVISKQYGEMAKAMEDLIQVVKDLKGNKDEQKDEIEEFAEEWGLNAEGAKALVKMLEKKLSTNIGLSKRESDEDGKKETAEEKKEPENTALKIRKIEIAIESEYEDYLDSYPQAKGKINLKAIKSYILSDEENLSKQFSDVVNEMYPGVLANKAGVDGGSDIGAGSTDDEKEDWNDPKVLARLDRDPKLRAKYQDDLVARVRSSTKR